MVFISKVDENDDGGKKAGAQVDTVMKNLGESASGVL